MLYFIQVNIYTALMLLIYFLFLRNKPLHRLSRNYLIACAIVPVLIPFVALPQTVQQQLQHVATFRVALPEVIIDASARQVLGTAIQIQSFWLICGVGSFLFIVWHFWNGLRLWWLISKHPKENYSNYVLIRSCGYGPGSFGKYIFFPGEEVNNTILEHEKAHIRLHHSRDIIFINLTQVFMWPNLLLVWIRRELKEIHEFQADAHIDVNKQDYTQLLLGAVFNTTSIPIMHLFIIHPIKRRIMMLKKKGTASPMKAMLQVAISAGIFSVAAIVIQSCEKKVNQGAAKATSSPSQNRDVEFIKEDSIRKSADVMPAYIGGAEAMTGFLGKEIKYPEYAKANKIEGRVLVKFIISTKGRVVDPEIIKSPDSSLSREALSVVRRMPDWEPGRMADGRKVPVFFVLPISFKLQ